MAAQPEPWQASLQPSVTEIMDDITWFESFTFWIITVITIFVTILLAICLIRFRASANPNPSRTTHHTMLEVAWTVIPIIILVVIAIPSFRLLYKQLEIPEADMTVKVVGYQWYWGYEYPDEKYAGLSFDSVMLDDAERADKIAAKGLTEKDVPRLLAVDSDMVVPAGKVIRVQVTAADVIHSFAMPAFGVKVDAVPGRLNETWFMAREPGVYYGQCSELCGTNHAFMPIAIRVVTPEQFEAWAAAAKDDLEGAYEQLAAAIAADKKTVEIAQR
ncbi:MAG: cytochrome c oxidase subunit II [Hyphomicrobiales bacterium]|nr:MAG: cytochrome c oxidase subunit II [Hyphomicrobiales bacterium]